jgi:hypothetical protein
MKTRICGAARPGLTVARIRAVSMMVRSWISLAACVIALLLAGTPAPASAQSRLADVGVVLIAEIRDTAGWVALHDQVLRTAGQATNPVGVSVPGTSPRRSITLNEPRFTVSFLKGSRALMVTLTGKVAGGETVAALGGFQEAVLRSQASEGELELTYGLGSVTAYIIELHLTRE